MLVASKAMPLLRALLSMAILAWLAAVPANGQDVGGYTNMTYEPSHGTQIEYLSPDGKAFLWYPGNARIVTGQWKLEGADICFAYGGNTYNPVTGTRGGAWECMSLRTQQRGLAERAEGDIFGLARRRQVPFTLDRDRTTLQQIATRLSGGAQAPSPAAPGILGADGQVAIDCQSVAANAERSKADMAIAAGMYFHNRIMGKRCSGTDYERAFDLATRSGMGTDAFLDILRARAAEGFPNAIAALKRLGY